MTFWIGEALMLVAAAALFVWRNKPGAGFGIGPVLLFVVGGIVMLVGLTGCSKPGPVAQAITGCSEPGALYVAPKHIGLNGQSGSVAYRSGANGECVKAFEFE